MSEYLRAMSKTAEHAKLGKWLANIREALGMTQVQLAKRLGKTQSFVAKTETGQRRLDVVEFIALAKALGTSPERLFQRLLDQL
jgi:transcriptional regulator with XRE-family HTH domain